MVVFFLPTDLVRSSKKQYHVRMNTQFTLKLVLIVLMWLLSINSQANKMKPSAMALVCEVPSTLAHNKSVTDLIETDFSGGECETTKIRSIDPKNRLLWVKINISRNDEMMKKNQPLGLFISGKASSTAYLNGQLIGSNGRPALLKTNEIVGLMDTVFPLDKALLQESENELIVFLSAHHGFLDLGSPIHRISLGIYQNPTDNMLRYYWPSLLPFGVLLLGSFYLVLMTKMNPLPRKTYLLPLMASFAAAQLFVEVYRGLVAYPYPFHDWRLLLILLCSLGFGMCLLTYMLAMIKLKMQGQHLFASYTLTILLVMSVNGFDIKNILAILIPVVIALIYVAFAWQKAQHNMRFVFMLLLLFLLVIFLSAYAFIDTVYYYCVAILIFMLMAQQAVQASYTKKQQLKYQARATQLQQVIDQQEVQNNTDQLEIRSAGKVEWVLINEIAYCKGAGDYIELVLLGGNTKLFYGSLSELSLRLPTTFLKTHRSYLVNTTLIKSLERSGSGAGQLHLSHGFNVPVSRRILPKVREKLG